MTMLSFKEAESNYNKKEPCGREFQSLAVQGKKLLP